MKFSKVMPKGSTLRSNRREWHCILLYHMRCLFRPKQLTANLLFTILVVYIQSSVKELRFFQMFSDYFDFALTHKTFWNAPLSVSHMPNALRHFKIIQPAPRYCLGTRCTNAGPKIWHAYQESSTLHWCDE